MMRRCASVSQRAREERKVVQVKKKEEAKMEQDEEGTGANNVFSGSGQVSECT